MHTNKIDPTTGTELMPDSLAILHSRYAASGGETLNPVEGKVIQGDRPSSPDQFLAIARRYLPEEQANGMMRQEIEHPDARIVHYTVRAYHLITFALPTSQHKRPARSATSKQSG